MSRISAYTVVHHDKLTEQNGGDYLVLMLLVPAICMARAIVERIATAIFMSSRVAEDLHRKKTLKLTIRKFQASFWKFSYYLSAVIYGVSFISWEPYMQLPFTDYPNTVQPKMYWYYMVQIAFYLWMTVSLLWDVRMKDFYQMTTHHLVTLTLLILSYSYKLTNIGGLIMMLHDVADPLLEAAKMFRYLRNEMGSTISFIGFFLSFLGMRLFVYPMYAVYPALIQTWDLAVYMESELIYYIINPALIVLQGLNIFWSVLIVKVLVKVVRAGECKDNRSDDESD